MINMKKILLGFCSFALGITLAIHIVKINDSYIGDRVDIQEPISGSVMSSSSIAADTLSGNVMCNYSSIKINPLHAALNITLAATSSLYSSCLYRNGLGLEFYYINPSAVTSTVIVAGAGIDLASTSGATISPNERANIRCFRRDKGTTDCLIISGIN
jgi:hypothetical protein